MVESTTIAAIATAPGPGRRGIVRVSGRDAAELVRATLSAAEPPFDPALARAHARGRFDDGRGLQPVRLLWMRGPRSYTREDVAEFHLPGAEPLLARALERLVQLGAEPARPGEFTRRAFLNGRLDLSQAEGVLALTEAGNEAERAAAAQLLGGGLERRTRELSGGLADLLALCEASLDFDESEVGHVPEAELLEGWERAHRELVETLGWEVQRAAQSALVRVVLVGAPNAGKSSLWNALTGGRALVSPHAGTTRDSLTGAWHLGRATCLLVDGPGESSGASGPDARAQELFARRRGAAELVLRVADSCEANSLDTEAAQRESALVVWNKIDLPRAAPRAELARLCGALPHVAVSARQGSGLADLERAVEERLLHPGPAALEGGVARVLFARHREALLRARSELDAALVLLRERAPLDLLAETLRGALQALGELAGRTTSEDLLDRIFSRFCLGK